MSNADNVKHASNVSAATITELIKRLRSQIAGVVGVASFAEAQAIAGSLADLESAHVELTEQRRTTNRGLAYGMALAQDEAERLAQDARDYQREAMQAREREVSAQDAANSERMQRKAAEAALEEVRRVLEAERATRAYDDATTESPGPDAGNNLAEYPQRYEPSNQAQQIREYLAASADAPAGEILPCPFCGCESELVDVSLGEGRKAWYVRCMGAGCGAETDLFRGDDSNETARAAWNRRVYPAQTFAENERAAWRAECERLRETVTQPRFIMPLDSFALDIGIHPFSPVTFTADQLARILTAGDVSKVLYQFVMSNTERDSLNAKIESLGKDLESLRIKLLNAESKSRNCEDGYNRVLEISRKETERANAAEGAWQLSERRRDSDYYDLKNKIGEQELTINALTRERDSLKIDLGGLSLKEAEELGRLARERDELQRKSERLSAALNAEARSLNVFAHEVSPVPAGNVCAAMDPAALVIVGDVEYKIVRIGVHVRIEEKSKAGVLFSTRVVWLEWDPGRALWVSPMVRLRE